MREARRRLAAIGMGVGLLVLSAALGIQGVRACIAQILYRQCKYGSVKRYPMQATLRRGETAHRLYPHNYNFCVWAGELAWHGPDAPGGDRTERLNAARLWCDRGLAMNPYQSQLRMLKTRLLELESVEDAIAYWRRYVEWQFWEPYNHAVLADLYSKAGRIEEAFESLAWTEKSPHYEWARDQVRMAVRREKNAARDAAAGVPAATGGGGPSRRQEPVEPIKAGVR